MYKSLMSVLVVLVFAAPMVTGCVTDATGSTSLDWTTISAILNSTLVTQGIALVTSLLSKSISKDAVANEIAITEAAAWIYSQACVDQSIATQAEEYAIALIVKAGLSKSFRALLENYASAPALYVDYTSELVFAYNSFNK